MKYITKHLCSNTKIMAPRAAKRAKIRTTKIAR